MSAAGKKNPRTLVEGTVLVVSLFIMFGLIGYLIYHRITYEQRPPAIAIKPNFASVRKVDHVFYLPISVHNKGSEAVHNLWLQISLLSHHTPMESVEMTIDYLPADDKQKRIIIFQNDPRKSTLSYQASFDVP